MADVDKAVLRLGAYEAGRANPDGQVIDEAVELAGVLEADALPLNGVLDALGKKVDDGRDRTTPLPLGWPQVGFVASRRPAPCARSSQSQPVWAARTHGLAEVAAAHGRGAGAARGRAPVVR